MAAPATSASAPDAVLDLQRGRERLARTDALVHARVGAKRPAKGAHTATILSRIPQYDRTHVQGCVCKPAIAGGACCPTSVGSMGLQQLTRPQASPSHAHHSMGPMSGVALALSGFGLISGRQVLVGAHEATRHLRAVQAQTVAQAQTLAVTRERLAARHDLLHTADAVVRRHQAALALQADIKASIAEQSFNRWVPGRLQILSALGVLVTSGAHLLGAGPALLHGALAGAAVQTLFVLYGAAMAAKNLTLWWQEAVPNRAAPAAGAAQSTEVRYLTARADFARARRRQLLRTGAAWLAVSAASLMGAGIGLGLIMLPHAGMASAFATAGAGAAAMWFNSCSRYAPHLPVSGHIRRELLTGRLGRAELYARLAEQQAAIVAVNAHVTGLLRPLEQLQARIEQAFSPQCGADAFMVLPRAAARSLADNSASAKGGPNVSRLQLQAVTRYLQQERAMQCSWAQGTQATLAARQDELKKLLEPSCPHKRRRIHEALAAGTLSDDVVAEAARLFEADSQAAWEAAQRLAVIDELLASCSALAQTTAALAAPAASAASNELMTEVQQSWLDVRLQTMQLCGILRDGLSTACVRGEGASLKSNPQPHHLPLGSIYPLPEAASRLAAAAAPEIETLFVHAFFNPRRIEAEMDYLLTLEDHAAPGGALAHSPEPLAAAACRAPSKKTDAQPFVAAAASAATCCS